MDAGAWVEAKTGSRVAGGVAAAGGDRQRRLPRTGRGRGLREEHLDGEPERGRLGPYPQALEMVLIRVRTRAVLGRRSGRTPVVVPVEGPTGPARGAADPRPGRRPGRG